LQISASTVLFLQAAWIFRLTS